jgi:arylsulfatase A-like enzyme
MSRMGKIVAGLLTTITVLTALVAPAAQPGKARHVLIVVWDGMRPDFVNEKDTPTLYGLGSNGVVFEDQHPAYVSLTEANGASIFTGAYPGHTGILGDTEYRPDINPLGAVHMEEMATQRAGDKAAHGRYVGMPTLPEILRHEKQKSVVAGAKGIALLADRMVGPDLFAGQTLPEGLLPDLIQKHGEFPELVAEQPTREDWTTSSLIDPLWHNGVPPLTILWLNEPDLGQHRTGVGSEHSLAMIRNADANLARVLQALDDRGARSSTDVLVVSDHGFSTISAVVDVADSLQSAGVDAHREFLAAPKNGDVMVVGNGGSVFVYVIGHSDAIVKKVAGFFQGWNRTGVIFTRQPLAGTFALATVHDDAPTAPDVLVSLRWTAERNDVGAPGMLFSDVSTYGAGQGMHCSLSRYDMHNTLIAAGPDFRGGIVDHLPTGNIDLAPTVLWVLGVKPPKPMDGRVLTEALTIPGPKIKSYEPGHDEATAPIANGTWHQYLNSTRVNGVDYFDEGNGYQSP